MYRISSLTGRIAKAGQSAAYAPQGIKPLAAAFSTSQSTNKRIIGMQGSKISTEDFEKGGEHGMVPTWHKRYNYVYNMQKKSVEFDKLPANIGDPFMMEHKSVNLLRVLFVLFIIMYGIALPGVFAQGLKWKQPLPVYQNYRKNFD